MNPSFARRFVALAAIVLSLGCVSSLFAQTVVTFDSSDADGSALSFVRTVTADGTADFTFTSDVYLEYTYINNSESYHGLYALGEGNEGSGTALHITVAPGYVFDFHSFNYAAEVAPYGADNKLYLDVTYAGGATGSMSFDADDSNNPAFLGSLATFANDITGITISSNGYTLIGDITVSDIHQPTAVPEPAAIGALFGAAALLGAIAWRRRRVA